MVCKGESLKFGTNHRRSRTCSTSDRARPRSKDRTGNRVSSLPIWASSLSIWTSAPPIWGLSLSIWAVSRPACGLEANACTQAIFRRRLMPRRGTPMRMGRRMGKATMAGSRRTTPPPQTTLLSATASRRRPWRRWLLRREPRSRAESYRHPPPPGFRRRHSLLRSAA